MISNGSVATLCVRFGDFKIDSKLRGEKRAHRRLFGSRVGIYSRLRSGLYLIDEATPKITITLLPFRSERYQPMNNL